MSTPAEVVAEAFADARTNANNAETLLQQFTNQLNAAIQVAPLVDVSFTPITDPGSSTVPTGPTAPGSYTPPSAYTDGIISTLASVLTTRLAGGTGLAPAVETAIWDRAREREAALAQANIDEVARQNEALGWMLPTGALSAQTREAQRNYYDKVSGLSRDIAIKQADLEQTNMREAIAQANAYEEALSQIVQRRSQVSLEQYKASLQLFEAQVDSFRANIDGFRATVEQTVKHWEAQIKQLEAQRNYVLAAQRINADVVHANMNTLIEAAKTGAQVYAQLVAAAYHMINASAHVQASSGTSVQYDYSGSTSSSVAPIPSI